MITLDFETHAIQGNTSYNPPEPVGLAIKKGNRKGKYLAFGHPEGNNCEWQDVYEELHQIWESNEVLLFHNAKFDISVAMEHFDLPMPDPLHINDTMYLLFLDDPYSPSLSLKPSAERLLDWPPEEQDKLGDWILQYTDCRSRKEAGAWIAHTPGKLAAEYAIGDVDRTKALWDLLSPIIWKRDMQDAYVREQELMPITYYSEKQGVRVDTEELLKDLPIFEKTLDQVERRLCKRMKVKYLEFNKNEQVADALENAGLVQPEDWIKTPTGRRSTSKDNLDAAVKDPTLLALMRYRGALAGCLQTFARPWAELSAEDGRIHTTWNQVRTHDAGFKDSRGSRTGRLSGSKPSLMNVTTELSIVVPQGVRPPPLMRKYLLPEKGHVWLKRDYSSQEVRILAHLENGTLMEAYRVDPNLDPHEAARQLIHNITQVMFSRKDVKITAFSIVYGSGANSLSKQLGRSLQEATLIKEAYLNAFPGVRALQRQVSKRGKAGKSIRTWGGREYYVEPSRLLHGRRIDFAYKLLNYLIQGSAADQTKQCITDWWETKPKEDVFLATVHDEINISAPKKTWKNSMKHLQTSMDQDLFDLPMRSEGFYGPNWHATKACP